MAASALSRGLRVSSSFLSSPVCLCARIEARPVSHRAAHLTLDGVSALAASSSSLHRRFSSAARAQSSHGVRTLGVIGAGQMGLGIAFVAAKNARVQVLLSDNDPRAIDRGLELADSLLTKDVKKERLTESEAQEVRKRIVPSSNGLAGLASADLVIEAVSERLALKQAIFRELANICSSNAILATNTSSISVTKIAAAAVKEGESAATSSSPARVLGLHFFSPVPVMKLCEVIAGLQTSESVLSRARSFAESMGKTLVTAQDAPGFVSNRLLMPFLNEAIAALEAGIATKEDIDTTLKLGMGHPMGPLELADFIGLDTCLAIQETLARETGDSKYRPSVLLGRYVDAGWLGRKSGKGFYEYKK